MDKIKDMISAAAEKNPVKFKTGFEGIITQKLSDQLTAKKMHVGQNMFQPPVADDGINHPLEAEIG
jgi:hypothetical protein